MEGTAPKKKATTRAEAGIVEEGAEIMPQDEAIASGEAIPLDTETDQIVTTPQSEVRVSGMSEEEQTLPLTPVLVGPPAYGSPNPVSSASRLLPLETHPLAFLPEDDPARLDAEYGTGYLSDLSGDEIGSQFPGAPGRTDLDAALVGEGGTPEGGTTPPATSSYDSMTKDELLTEATSRGLDVNTSNTKAEIVAALEADDAA